MVGSKIGEGNPAEVFEYGDKHVIKLYRSGISSSICRDEFERTKVAYEANGLTPEPIEVVDINGRDGAVYQRINGKNALNTLTAKPWRYSRFAKCMAEYHVALQKPVADTRIPSVKEALIEGIDDSDFLSSHNKQQLYEYIARLPEGNTLCHLDYHPGNMLVTDDGYIIIDWMTACRGDCAADAARTSIILQYSQIPNVPKAVNVLLSGFRRKILKIYLAEYTRLSGCSLDDIQRWKLPVAAARLREWLPAAEKELLFSLVKQQLSIVNQDK